MDKVVSHKVHGHKTSPLGKASHNGVGMDGDGCIEGSMESGSSELCQLSKLQLQFPEHQLPLLSPSLMFHEKKDRKYDVTSLLASHLKDKPTKQTCQVLSIFKDQETFCIPNKVRAAVRHILKGKLKQINKDIETAREMLLIMLSYFTRTNFEYINENKNDGIVLYSHYLKDSFGNVYKKMLQVLERGTAQKGGIIELRKNYFPGRHSKVYALTPTYLGKGVEYYKVTRPKTKEISRQAFWRNMSVAIANPICRNLMDLYSHITLPSIEEIKTQANKLMSQNYKTKKRKILNWKGTHSRNYWGNPEKYSFVEDSIKLFEHLTKGGFMIPKPGNERSGGRVVDSFTLMPSWIRSLVKINGKPIYEADYSCFHPNIAVRLYAPREEQKPITHEAVAEYLGISRQEAKIEHLSFFNEEIWQMKKSPLFKYYEDNFPVMLSNIIQEKMESPYKHKITSARLFDCEVRLMTKAIQLLNQSGIHVLYVYDALMSTQKNIKLVAILMNIIAKGDGILTKTKTDID